MAHEQDIWLDGIARLLGFGWVSRKLPGSIAPSYIYIITFVAIDVGVLQVLKKLGGEEMTFIENPFWLLTQGALILAVFAIHKMHTEYENAKIRLQIEKRTEDLSKFEHLGSHKLRWVFFLLGAAVLLINAIFVISLSLIYEVDGIPGLVGNLVLVPFVYVPVGIDFLATYFSVQVLLPRRIRQSELNLDFLDPENMGGLRPVGALLKLSYYYVVLGFVSFALFTYGPWVFPDLLYAPYKPGPITNAIYTVGWVGSVALLGYGLYTLHRFMQRQKREELRRLDQEVKDKVEKPWDVQNFKIPDEKQESYEDLRRRMEYVSSTREYPATFTMWTQILISAFIPKALQMILTI